ncbi:hypothetical protein [Chryseobacterium sp. GP-SGM7]|uniref:hypothetical protein n=1 Tax=Chryseobacterium sp. GP-SGM7 TaxID=3411323 RepID=UPI003B936673
MKKLLLAAFALGGIYTVSAQTVPQKNKSNTSSFTTPSTKNQRTLIPRANLKSDVNIITNNGISSGNNINGSLNNSLGTMNNGSINSSNPNGTMPLSTGIIDNKISSPGTVNIGTTGSLNTSGTVNTGAPMPMSGTGTVNK